VTFDHRFDSISKHSPMSTPIKNTTLKFPCQEKWDQLEVVPGGRLCQSCAHIVKDFRDCSQEELNSQLDTQSHVCGIFRKDQLSSAFLKAAAVAVAVTSLGACETEQQPTPEPGTVVFEDLDTQILSEVDTTVGDVVMGIVINPLPDSTQNP